MTNYKLLRFSNLLLTGTFDILSALCLAKINRSFVIDMTLAAICHINRYRIFDAARFEFWAPLSAASVDRIIHAIRSWPRLKRITRYDTLLQFITIIH